MNNSFKNKWPIAMLAISAYLMFAFNFAKKYELGFNLTQGKKYVYASTANQVISQEANGQKMEFKQSFGFNYLLDVQAKDKEKNSTVNFVYDKIKVKMENPMMNVDYDSSNPAADVSNPMAKVFASMKGLGLQATVTPLGTITAVQGVEKMVNSMASSIAENDTAKLASIKESLATQFGEANQKSSLEGITRIYPPTKVAIGETWTIVTEQRSVFPVKAENVYTLVAVNGDVAKISLTAKVSGSGTVNGGDLALKGDQTGEMEINIKTGLIIKSSNVQKLSGTMTMQGMTVPMKLTTTATLAGTER